jgi:hypothetical protein
MSDVIEAPIDNWLASFDGRVLEVFTPYQEGSMRYHAALMLDCRIDGTTLTIDFQRRGIGLWPFRPEQLAQVTELVNAVRAARSAWWGPDHQTN